LREDNSDAIEIYFSDFDRVIRVIETEIFLLRLKFSIVTEFFLIVTDRNHANRPNVTVSLLPFMTL